MRFELRKETSKRPPQKMSKLPAIHRRDSNEIEERMLNRVGNREETRRRKVKRVRGKWGGRGNCAKSPTCV